MIHFNYEEKIKLILCNLIVTDKNQVISHDQSSDRVVELFNEVFKKRSSIFWIGNGASAAMAQSICFDFTKLFKIKGQTLSETPLLTSLANDFSYGQVYARGLEIYASSGDILVALSTSGESVNIYEACLKAKKLNDIFIITLTGHQENNKIRSIGDLNFYCPIEETNAIQLVHYALLNYWKYVLQQRK